MKAAAAFRPSHSTPPTIEATSITLTVPNETATTRSGRTRRHGNRNARPAVVASETAGHTSRSSVNVSDRRGNDHDEDEQPVAVRARGSSTRSCARPTARLQRHADRVRDPGTRADRPKVRSAGQPTGGRRSDRTPDADCRRSLTMPSMSVPPNPSPPDQCPPDQCPPDQCPPTRAAVLGQAERHQEPDVIEVRDSPSASGPRRRRRPQPTWRPAGSPASSVPTAPASPPPCG